MIRINIHQAKTHLSRYIAEALRGEDVLIQKAGEPLVILRPWSKTLGTKERRGGGWKGRVKLYNNFDEPLPSEISDAFGISATIGVLTKKKSRPSRNA